MKLKLSGPFKPPKSKRGALRQYDAIIRAAYRAGRGGTQFGIDWPTFRITWPVAYAHIQSMRKAYALLPERTS